MIQRIRDWLQAIGKAIDSPEFSPENFEGKTIEVVYDGKKIQPVVPPRPPYVIDQTKRAWGHNLEVVRRLNFDGSRIMVVAFHPDIDISRLRLIPGGHGALATGKAVELQPGDLVRVPGDLRIPAWHGALPEDASAADRDYAGPLKLGYNHPLTYKVLECQRARGAMGRIDPPDQWSGVLELVGEEVPGGVAG